jgi:hypothetical protein
MPAIDRLLESPLTALVVAILFGAFALSGKLSVTLSQLALALTWLVIAFALRDQPWQVFAGSAAIAAGSLILLAYWLRPDLVPANVGILQPKAETIFSPQTGLKDRKLEIGDSGTIINYTGPDGTPVINLWNEDKKVLADN